MRTNWNPPEMHPELRPLAEAEAAARSAVDHAMVKQTSAAELARLQAIWSEANDQLADKIVDLERQCAEQRSRDPDPTSTVNRGGSRPRLT